MTTKHTHNDTLELVQAFPDIANMKNGVSEDKTPLRVPKQGDIELYSNFGFMPKNYKLSLTNSNICGRRIMVITRASQARDVSSILIARSSPASFYAWMIIPS